MPGTPPNANSLPPPGGVRSTPFLRLWAGSTASGLATWALPFVLGLAVLEGALTAMQLGLVLAARTTGFLAAMPVSGVLADRFARRGVVLYASLLAAMGIPVLLLMLGSTSPSAPALMMLGAAIAGMGQGACRPAYQALVPLVVGRDGLQAANAAMSISVRVTALLGPTLATALAVTVSARATLAVIIVMWLASAFLPPRPAEPPRTGAARLTGSGFPADFADGFREAGRHPWFIAGLAALTTVICLGYSVTGVILPIVSRDRTGGAALLVAATTAYTFGALLGALLTARWRPRHQGWSALAGLALYCLVPFSLLADLPLVVPLAAFLLAGVGIELFNVPWFTATQREVPPERLARVTSIDFLFSYGLAPLGLAAIAPAAEAFGIAPVLAVCGTACLLAPLVAMLPRSSRGFTSRPARG
ncbi:MAG: MFS transporter [Alphaproteobacteria bacterium]|nr:MFS transporter [Alphaproteobacteria bacterium]